MYYSNTAAGFEKKSGFNRIADREGFIVVYPNAVAFGPKQKQLWNGGGIYEIWWGGRVEELTGLSSTELDLQYGAYLQNTRDTLDQQRRTPIGKE